MTSAESLNYARRYLSKANEYLETAQDSLDLDWATAAAGNAIHAGISAKDAIVTALTGATSKLERWSSWPTRSSANARTSGTHLVDPPFLTHTAGQAPRIDSR